MHACVIDNVYVLVMVNMRRLKDAICVCVCVCVCVYVLPSIPFVNDDYYLWLEQRLICHSYIADVLWVPLWAYKIQFVKRTLICSNCTTYSHVLVSTVYHSQKNLKLVKLNIHKYKNRRQARWGPNMVQSKRSQKLTNFPWLSPHASFQNSSILLQPLSLVTLFAALWQCLCSVSHYSSIKHYGIFIC
jgi:hypothetical protein